MSEQDDAAEEWRLAEIFQRRAREDLRRGKGRCTELNEPAGCGIHQGLEWGVALKVIPCSALS